MKRERIRREWRELRGDPPGERFQRYHDRRHESGESAARRVAWVALGVAVVAAGIFFLPAPGPGMLIVALGVALLARESRVVARAADRAELGCLVADRHAGRCDATYTWVQRVLEAP